MFRGLLTGIFCLFCIIFCANVVTAHEIIAVEPPKNILNDELISANEDLKTLQPGPQQDGALYITSYNLPPDLQRSAFNVLNITIHSLSYGKVIVPPTVVTPTLFRINIYDYEWTDAAIEKVSRFDPYFRLPWIDNEQYKLMMTLAGNRIVRHDWFCANTLDTAKQVDHDIKDIFYFTLLYANAPFGIPKNLDEYRKTWGVDANKIESLGLPTGGVVKDGKSAVAHYNRQLAYSRIETGYHWESSDYKNNLGRRDIIENLKPGVLSRKDADAHEIITTNFVGAQVYFLTDGKFNSANIGDTGLVKDTVDPHNNDVRVKMARSCMKCHNILGDGIVPFLDQIRDMNTNGTNLKVNLYSRQDYKRFYLSKELDHAIDDSNRFYLRAVNNIVKVNNPLESTESVGKLLELHIQEYEKDIDLAKAARECGSTVENFVLKLRPTVRGRLADLISRNETIPRTVWEDSAFRDAMVFLYNIKVVVNPITQTQYVTTIYDNVQLFDPKNSKKVVATVHNAGTKLLIKKENKQTITVLYKNSHGNVYTLNVKRKDVIY